MKTITTLLAILLASMPLVAKPLSVGDQLAELRTLDGVIYKEVTIRKILPEGISILHSAGAKTVLATDLPDEIKEGLVFLSAEEIAAKRANEDRAAAMASRPKNKAPAAPAAPRYITPQQMKVYWLNKLPVPASLSPTYSQEMKARQQFIADVRAGKYEARAAQAAASYNRDLAIRVGDMERAQLYGQDLARADALLAQETAVLAAQEANSELRGAMETIRLDLNQIHNQMVIEANRR